jgi:transposase
MNANQNLPENISELKAIIAQQVLQHETQLQIKDEQIKSRDDEIEFLQEALRLARMLRFASQSEKLPSQQSELFDEVEVQSSVEIKSEEEELEESETIEVPAHSRKRGKRRPLPDHLPRVEVIIDLNEAEKVCVKDGSILREIGSEVSEQLDVIPLQVKVIRTIRKKYICECCESSGENTNIKTAAMPEQILPKSNATAGLLAYIATAKYVDALPLYRQEEILKRHGVEMRRNTMCRWMIDLTEKLQPIYSVMEKDLLASNYISCDETKVQVLKESGKSAESLSYMWVRTRHGPNTNPIVLFDYDPTRSKEVTKQLFKGFKGYLQVDGYAGYDEICKSQDITRVGCMAHVRRKFFETHKASKKSGGEANRILKLIQKLYEVEKEIKEKTTNERKETRLTKATPILNEIKTWLDANQKKYPPQGLMGKAITYATNQWDNVINYLKDGKIEIDNNFTENRIRPFAIGRKNWLFSDSVSGAKSSAMLYSILQTARGNGLEPYVYLRHLLTELPKCKTADQIEKLSPHKIDFKILN